MAILVGLTVLLVVGVAGSVSLSVPRPSHAQGLAAAGTPSVTPILPADIPDLPMWYCPSATPLPSATPRATECWIDPHWTPPAQTPGLPTATPPTICSEPESTPTPFPSPTPYLRQEYFYYNQNIYAGPLRITLKRCWRESGYPVATPRPDYDFHYCDVEIYNTGSATLTVWLPVQMAIRRVDTAEGARIGRWVPSEWAMRNIGKTYDVGGPDNPNNPYVKPLDRHEARTLTIGFEAPAGTPMIVGISLDNSEVGPDPDLPGMNILWWWLSEDPYCEGNIEDAPFSGGGGTPVPWPPPAGCPLPVSAGTGVSRGFGCSSFWTGTVGAGCPPEAPYFHKGIDFRLSSGSPIYSVVNGTVGYAGPGSSPYCDWGDNDPKYGFGYYVRVDYGNAQIYHAHGQLPWLVSADQQVQVGQNILWSDSTGCSLGAHLHWEIRVDGVSVDPLQWLIDNVCSP